MSVSQGYQPYPGQPQTINVAQFLALIEDYKGSTVKHMLDLENVS
jgi:hypothetical protein